MQENTWALSAIVKAIVRASGWHLITFRVFMNGTGALAGAAGTAQEEACGVERDKSHMQILAYAGASTSRPHSCSTPNCIYSLNTHQTRA